MMNDAHHHHSVDVEGLLAAMTIDEKATLTVGADMWSTRAIARLGIPSVTVTDGPAGARGPVLPGIGEQSGSLLAPCGTALGATWDVDLLRRVGAALGQQARTKTARVLLAPTVNIHRSPLAGRTFECYSEDPVLAGRLAAAFVGGAQSAGVATTVKHFVANEQETERMTIDTIVDERTLREIYLVPFEMAVRDGGSLGIMTAYNRLNGPYCAEHDELLVDILRGEWGFDGFVVTDWYAGADTVRSAAAGLDLEMPGPARAYGKHLAAAVREGRVPEEHLDAIARRLLSVWARLGAFTDPVDAVPAGDDRAEHRALAREATVGSIVLLRNDGVLPLEPTRLRTVALIGPNADRLRLLGGGSAEVQPHHHESFIDVLREALGDGVEIVHRSGCDIERTIPPIEPHLVPAGFTVDVYDGDVIGGDAVVRTTRADGRVFVVPRQDHGVPVGAMAFVARGEVQVADDGVYVVSMVQVGTGAGSGSRLLIDGVTVFDCIADPPPAGDTYFGMGSAELRTEMYLESNRPVMVELEYTSPRAGWAHGAQIGIRPVVAADAMEQAVDAARNADVAIVVVGTNDDWETEGRDRTDLDLPGRQAELIRRVREVNPTTVVVLNTGAPVDTGFADTRAPVAAVLQAWFGGQEMARALVDVLVGRADPGGRLPLTFPRQLRDTPAYGNFPGEHGQVRYGEGLLVGYRWYDTRGIEPAYPFGHGMSYADIDLGEPTVTVDGDAMSDDLHVSLDVPVLNRSARAGTVVVQCYVHDATAAVARPEQELRAFAKMHLAADGTGSLRLDLDRRAFAHWDVGDRYRDARRPGQGGRTEVAALSDESRGWRVSPGDYELRIGRSSRDIVHTVTISL
jgi:beta-glucosidase